MNVLANIMKKRAMNIFWSFKDPDPEKNRGRGDVRYHLGYSSDWRTSDGHELHISMCFNPSHLEFVNPVALGRCRSKQDRMGDSDRKQVMPILVHGDAAFAGEGVVQETLNLSLLPGYACGGALHVIINNQIGFTTEPMQGRSTTYATDVAKMLQSPIFHVNGEDPEAVAQAIAVAMDFRHTFQRDVVVDLWAYRRWGHNEADEPRFTQPLMYSNIDSRKTVRDRYLQRLIAMGQMTEEEAQKIQQERLDKLQREFDASENTTFVQDEQTLGGVWSDYSGGPEPTREELPFNTKITHEKFASLLDALTRVPKGFSIHRKLKRPMVTFRREMAEGQRPLDWSSAEALAFASLADEGFPVRLTGQDSQRGTFSQRHAVFHDSRDGSIYMPLQQITESAAPVEIVNSP
ncbi:MAG: thiamine pyrophosphate-dependent enzyme, partial [Planctomycetota bacterium]